MPIAKFKPKRTTAFGSLVVVSGNATDVFDMLRYDSCHPATEREARIMHNAALNYTTATFVLTRRALNDSGVTVDRWRSYAFKVLGEYNDFDVAERVADESDPRRIK